MSVGTFGSTVVFEVLIAEPLAVTVYADDAVGNININNGYLFARLFDSGAPAAGSYFVEVGLQAGKGAQRKHRKVITGTREQRPLVLLAIALDFIAQYP